MPQMELRFLDYIVWPLWERLAAVLPELAPALATLKRNRELYAALAESVEKEQALRAQHATQQPEQQPEQQPVQQPEQQLGQQPEQHLQNQDAGGVSQPDAGA